ncbi:MAG: aminoglycoside 6'-N-acetyltransferase [Pyrinomonadaceae bacterium]
MSEFRYSVRPLSEKDLQEWLRLRKQLWDATNDADHRSEMVDIIDHPDSQFVLVAEHEAGNLIGFLEVSIRPFVEDCVSDHVGYLEGWYVEPQFRGHGIGRELVRIAENWAREKGCEEMASDAELGNDISLSAHQNLGYVETSRLVHLRKEL